MYTEVDFKTKKELIEAVKKGEQIRVIQPNDMFNVNEKYRDGKQSVTVEGPHFSRPHSWYARVDIENGIIVKVRKT
jgi:hypothetical protein